MLLDNQSCRSDSLRSCCNRRDLTGFDADRHDIRCGTDQEVVRYGCTMLFAFHDGHRLCRVIREVVYIQEFEWRGSRLIVSLTVAMSLKDILPPSFSNSLRLYC